MVDASLLYRHATAHRYNMFIIIYYYILLLHIIIMKKIVKKKLWMLFNNLLPLYLFMSDKLYLSASLRTFSSYYTNIYIYIMIIWLSPIAIHVAKNDNGDRLCRPAKWKVHAHALKMHLD